MKDKSTRPEIDPKEVGFLTLFITSPILCEGMNPTTCLLMVCAGLVDLSVRRASNYQYGLFGAGVRVLNECSEVLTLFANEELHL